MKILFRIKCLFPTLLLVFASAFLQAEEKTLPLQLPPQIYAVPGIECNVYFENLVLTLKPDNYAFEVKCKVIDSVTGNPVKGVMMTPGFTYSYGNMSGFQQTGLSSEISDGVFEIRGHQDIGADYNKLEVKLTDNDPATDGHYKDTVYVISLEKIKDADSGWCEGTYAADVTVEAEQAE